MYMPNLFIYYAFTKTIVFAFIIATVPSYFGYFVKGGSLEVGRASTQAVVWTMVFIIISEIFNPINIKLMIEVKDLKKSFGDVEVLKGISTSFDKGKVNLIIGQSGSGKTVFLKSLLNVYMPSSGEILFDGKDINTMTRDEKQHLRSEIGTVFQGSALFDSLTVEENIMFPLDMFTNLTYREKKEKSFRSNRKSTP